MNGTRQEVSRRGFTLLELLLAVAIMAGVSVVTYLTFSTVVRAWQKGMVLADNLHHGDFAADQLMMALRSAYYPDAVKDDSYGLWMEDEGEGDGVGDTISWVKLGSSLVGDHCPFAGSPHRVKVTLEEDEDGKEGLAVRAWQLLGVEDDFDPDEIEPLVLSTRVTGLNIRFQDPESEEGEDEIEWIDEWEDTNRIPRVVELTVYTEPLAKGEDPVEIKRIIAIPTAPLSWP